MRRHFLFIVRRAHLRWECLSRNHQNQFLSPKLIFSSFIAQSTLSSLVGGLTNRSSTSAQKIPAIRVLVTRPQQISRTRNFFPELKKLLYYNMVAATTKTQITPIQEGSSDDTSSWGEDFTSTDVSVVLTFPFFCFLEVFLALPVLGIFFLYSLGDTTTSILTLTFTINRVPARDLHAKAHQMATKCKLLRACLLFLLMMVTDVVFRIMMINELFIHFKQNQIQVQIGV